MEKYNIVVVGGGPAGMMAAVKAAERGCSVLLLEKMERCGRKLSITGKGRCNLTNTKEWSDFSTHIYPQPDFLRPAFWGFSNQAVVEFFSQMGIETVVERGDRLFPVCQDARKVAEALEKWIKKQGVNVSTGGKVSRLEVANGRIISVHYTKNGANRLVEADAVILATGGLSYPLTGSTGDGYTVAEAAGHAIAPCFPSLTALMPKEYDCRLQGVTLTNISLSLLVNSKVVQEEFGEVAFTDLGIEGPLGLRLSRNAVVAMRNGAKVSIVLNLKPAISREQLEARLRLEIKQFNNEVIQIFLKRYLPNNLILSFINTISVKHNTLIRSISIENIQILLQRLQYWEFPIGSHGGYERAVVTAGGVSLKEIHKRNMQSKMIENLFFAGEIIDLDGDTGGYNLQIAFSTGALAGVGAAGLLNRKA